MTLGYEDLGTWFKSFGICLCFILLLKLLTACFPVARSTIAPIIITLLVVTIMAGVSFFRLNNVGLFSQSEPDKGQLEIWNNCTDSAAEFGQCDYSNLNENEQSSKETESILQIDDVSDETFFGKTAEDISQMSKKELFEFVFNATNGSIDLENRTQSIIDSFKETASGTKQVIIESEEDIAKFLATFDEMKARNPSQANIYLAHALKDGLPFSSVKDIVNKGTDLTALHVFVLASKINVDQIKELENSGVDIAATTSTGSNMLIRSLSNRKFPEVFDYLLQHDALVFPENTDVLKEVMEQSAWLDRDISYVEKLINRGVKVSAETKKWAEKDLKDINEEYYASIKHLLI